VIFVNRRLLLPKLSCPPNFIKPTPTVNNKNHQGHWQCVPKKTFNMKKLLFLLLFILPGLSYAHGGHGIFDPHTLMHYIGTPEHGLPILALSLFAGWLWYRHRQKAHQS
jgi:hypothetical protein